MEQISPVIGFSLTFPSKKVKWAFYMYHIVLHTYITRQVTFFYMQVIQIFFIYLSIKMYQIMWQHVVK